MKYLNVISLNLLQRLIHSGNSPGVTMRKKPPESSLSLNRVGNTVTKNPAASPPIKRSRFLSYLNKKRVTQTEGQDTYSIQIGDHFRVPEICEEDNPLGSGEVNQTQFPSLAKLACRYLHIPESSSLDEWVFSIAGNFQARQGKFVRFIYLFIYLLSFI